MPHLAEGIPDPLKPGLIRHNQDERVIPASSWADPLPLPAFTHPSRWESAEITGVNPTRIWLPAATLAEESIPPQAIWSILVVTGDPSANGNRFDREIAHMRAALSGIPMTERASISAHELAECLRQNRPAVLHLCAHASEELLALHVDGRINWAPFAVIAEMLRHLPAPKLLVLNICSCKALADLLATWATTTVYWTDPIDDDIARAFSSPFYQALLGGESVSDAITIARADTAQLLGQRPEVHGKRDLVLVPRTRAK